MFLSEEDGAPIFRKSSERDTSQVKEKNTKELIRRRRRLADKMPTSEDGSSSSTYEKVRKM